MKHAFLGAGALAFAVLVSGCNFSTDVTLANNALATLAKNDIPTACQTIGVAEMYFGELESLLSTAEIADETKAANAVNIICANPPVNIDQAFGTLLQEWTAIQADTQIPVPTPTPTPTPTPVPTPTSN